MKPAVMLISAILLTSSLFLVACDDEMEHRIAMHLMFGGWDDEGTNDTQPATDTKLPNDGKLQPFPAPLDCSKVANSVKDPITGMCFCKPGYTEINRQCISEDSPQAKKECVFDRDCSPEGVISKCINKETKAVYQCDLQTWKCVGGKGNVAQYVSCKSEYGADYSCKNGLCVQG